MFGKDESASKHVLRASGDLSAHPCTSACTSLALMDVFATDSNVSSASKVNLGLTEELIAFVKQRTAAAIERIGLQLFVA